MSRDNLVVRPHRPWKMRLLWAIAFVVVVMAFYGAFEYGRIQGGYDRSLAQQEKRELRRELAQERETVRKLRERVALLERSSEVDREARERVRQEVASLQDEILELREELAFYRGIVSPEDGQRGLKVQSFWVRPREEAGHYAYRLMLIQAVKHDSRVRGTVSVTIHGVRDGESHAIDLAEVSDEDEMAFSFRYFQGFKGEMVLPEGFTPRQIEVSVRPSGRGRDNVTRTYDWAALTG